ncbi:MAG: hypothetical protein K1X64_18420 [Myxococcaceae bacterium]|nr:hypothetical protein [Myxococcaceae bacterium]
MLTALLVIAPALLAAEPEKPYTLIDDDNGMRIEAREVDGSNFEEYRLTVTTPKGVDILCDSAFGDGRFDAREEYLLTRKVLSESEDERTMYEQRYAPVVSNRDYVVCAKRTLETGKRCRVEFHLTNEKGPSVPKGFVRMKRLSGAWTIERLGEGKTQVVYVVHTDLNGGVPAFLASKGMRASAAKWVRLVIERAGEKKTAAVQPETMGAAHATE